MNRSAFHTGAVLLSLLLTVGCASVSPEEQARRDVVLQQYRTGSSAMRAGQYDRARSQLDAALLALGGSTAGDSSARQSRRFFNEESVKVFRGEPYERVMAYYYRGILYWMEGEPDNARAAFRSAAVQDADPEQGEYQADWVLLDYLDGYVTAKLGGDGADAWARSQQHAKGPKPPPYDVAANVLVFLEMGQGPTKYAAGEFGEQLRFRPGTTPDPIAVFTAGGQSVRAGVYDDLSFQATTRGGRAMDHVLKGKAVFKGATETFGTAAIIAGTTTAIASNSQTGQNVGLGLALAGVVSHVVSAATTPQADTRQWNNLPNGLSFAALQLAPGTYDGRVEFQSEQGAVRVTRPVRFEVVAGRDTVLLLSDRNH